MKHSAIAIALCLVALGASAGGPIPTGTWIKRGETRAPMMMIVESAGPGVKITYRIMGADGKPMSQNLMTVVTMLDGKEFGTSKLEVSSDGKVLKVENHTASWAGQPANDTTEYWDKQ